MNRSRVTGDLASHGNIFVDIANDRVGIGSTIPGQKLSLPDSARIALGNSADLELYHDGTDSHLANKTGQLRLGQGGTNVELYYGSVKCFHTHGDNGGSIGMFRNLTAADNTQIMLGASADYRFFHEGSSNKNVITCSTAGLEVRKNNTTEVSAKFIADGAAELYHNNVKKLETKSSGINVDGHVHATQTGAQVASGDPSLGASGAYIMLYHDGSNGFIQNGSGGITIKDVSGGNIEIQATDNETSILCNHNGAVELYHDNAKKLETTTYGVNVTGTTDTDGLVVSGISTVSGSVEISGHGALVGTPHKYFYGRGGTQAGGLSIHAMESSLELVSSEDSTHGGSILLRTVNDGAGLVYNSSTNALEFNFFTPSSDHFAIHGGGVNVSSLDTQLRIVKDAAVELYHNGTKKLETSSTGVILSSTDAGSSAEPELVLYRNSASPADADYLGQIKFNGKSDTGAQRTYAKITGKILDASNSTEDGIIEFAHIKAGSQVITGRFRSDSLQLLNSTNFSVAGTSEFTGDATFNGGAGAVTVAAGSDISFTNSTTQWTGDNLAKIQHFNGVLYISGGASGIIFREAGTSRWRINGDGHFIPEQGDGTLDIGSNSVRVRNGYFDTLYGNGANVTNVDAATLDGVDGANYVRTNQNTTITSDLFIGGGGGGITVNAGSDIRFTNGDWTGNVGSGTAKIQHHANYLYIAGGSNGIVFRENNDNRWILDGSGHFMPGVDSTYDIGANGTRVRNGYFDTLYGDGSNITGVNATTLDSIDSGSFLRSDAADTFTNALTFSQDNTDVVNFSANSSNNNRGISFNNRTALSAGGTSNGWLRLNNASEFTNGVYTPGLLRVDGSVRIAQKIVVSADNTFAGQSVGHAATYDEGIFWHTDNGYGIYRTSGAWSGDFQQLKLKWLTGIILDGGNQYGKSGVEVVGDMNNVFRINTINDGKIQLKGSSNPYIRFQEGTTDKAYIQWNSGGYITLVNQESDEQLRIGSGSNGLVFWEGGSGKTVWHSGNDGSGSGLDADLLDGSEKSAFVLNNQNSGYVLKFGSGSNTSNTASSLAYAIFQEGGAWTSPFPDLRINYHTGIVLAANASYGGIRFQRDYNNTLQLMSVGDGDNHVRFTYDIRGTVNHQTNIGTSSVRMGTIYANNISLSGTNAIERAETLRYRDLRNVAPADESANMLRFYFTSWGNTGNTTGYADGLHMRSYGDSSGGSDNLVVWYKNGFGMRQFQQSFGSSTDYSNYAQYFHGQSHAIPQQNNTFDLGSTSYRWRNVYTQDLQLSNEAKKEEGGNDVDGTWGSYTIQEGEDDLFLINRRSGKKYKFNLTEVS